MTYWRQPSRMQPLQGVFGESTSDDDQDADRPDLGEKRPPEEPAKQRDAKHRAQRRTQQPACGGVFKNHGPVMHQVVCPMGGCELSSCTWLHVAPPVLVRSRPAASSRVVRRKLASLLTAYSRARCQPKPRSVLPSLPDQPCRSSVLRLSGSGRGLRAAREGTVLPRGSSLPGRCSYEPVPKVVRAMTASTTTVRKATTALRLPSSPLTIHSGK